MIKLDRGIQLLRAGYSVLLIKPDKKPVPEYFPDEPEGSQYKWGHHTSTPYTETELETKVKTSQNVKWYGYCCGYSGLFVLDLDLKVLPVELRQPFWEEFYEFARNHIDQLDRKVAIHRTQNFGYHLTWRTTLETRNQKLAVSKFSKQALIETRGKGGYAVLYEDCVNGLDYVQAQYLTDEEHETLLGIAQIYDESKNEPEPVVTPPTASAKLRTAQPNGPTAWEDYNAKHSWQDVAGDEFRVVRDLASRTVIIRHGATSSHSGYVYKDSGLMYLFSSGTHYPAEKPLNPFQLYTWRYHQGDHKAAASALYAKGYGARLKPDPVVLAAPVKPETVTSSFPLEVYPPHIRHYIEESSAKSDLVADFMASSVLWVLSLIIGNSFKVVAKSNWVESGVIWMCLVGKAGVSKTPSIKNIIQPLEIISGNNAKLYEKKKKQFDEYDALSKEEKSKTQEVFKPHKEQFIVGDLTLESLIELHEMNPNAIGVFKDELAGWVKDMNKYRTGSDLEFWLSAWSCSSVSVLRKTVKSNYIRAPFFPVLGGIQPKILARIFGQEMQENGFVDRLLLCYPDAEVSDYIEAEVPGDVIQRYNDYINNFYYSVKALMVKDDEGDEVKAKLLTIEKKRAKQRVVKAINTIAQRQRSPDEPVYVQGMLSKQRAYLYRFSLLLQVLWNHYNDKPLDSQIQAEAVEGAEKLVNYFVAMSKKVTQQGRDQGELEERVHGLKGKSAQDKFKAMYQADPGLNKTHAADVLGVTRQTIINWSKTLAGDK